MSIALCSAGIILNSFFFERKELQILSTILSVYGLIFIPILLVYFLPKRIKKDKSIYFKIINRLNFKNENRKDTRNRIAKKMTKNLQKGQKIPFSVLREIIEETQKKEEEKKILKERWEYSFPD